LIPWETLSVEEILDRLHDLAQLLPEPSRLEAEAGFQLLADHINDLNSDLEDIEQEAS
jgi:hypothetical protein